MPKNLRVQASLFCKSYRTRGSGRSPGNLNGFMDLPMDVVFEVSPRTISSKCGHPMTHAFFQTAMYLAPRDLLQISRLSKQFRSMFASRSALFVWQTVFRNVNLKCFEDLNEIQFASLLYDKFCMVQLLSFLYHIIYTHEFFMFRILSGMRTYHEGMRGISDASFEIVSILSNCEVKNCF